MTYSLAYAYALNKTVDLSAGINGWVKSKDKLEDEKRDNTSGHVMYTTPGVHLKFAPRYDASFGYSIPIVKNVNGDDGGSGKFAYPEGQGIEDNRLIVRLGYNF